MSIPRRFYVKRCEDGALALMVNGWTDKENTNDKPVPLVVTVRTGSSKKELRRELKEIADEFNLILEAGLKYARDEWAT